MQRYSPNDSVGKRIEAELPSVPKTFTPWIRRDLVLDICLNEGNIRERFLIESEGVTKAQLKTGSQNDVATEAEMDERGWST